MKRDFFLKNSDYDWETGDNKSVDEVAAQNHTNELNNLIDLGVYYDKGSNKQADIKFEYYYEEIYDYEGDFSTVLYRRDLYPIIVFNDGSKNRIEDFFTEQAFSKLIYMFNSIYDLDDNPRYEDKTHYIYLACYCFADVQT